MERREPRWYPAWLALRRSVNEDAERRHVRTWRRVNWPLHCGVYLRIERWDVWRRSQNHPERVSEETFSSEPFFVCPVCKGCGYRDNFEPNLLLSGRSPMDASFRVIGSQLRRKVTGISSRKPRKPADSGS